MEQGQFQSAYGQMKEWLGRADLSLKIKSELEELEQRLSRDMADEEAKEEILDRFYKDLDFGTGGLRGFLGAGTNRMNIYTVQRVTQGFASYLRNQYGDQERELSVAIAYDSRIQSDRFALEAASVFLANGFRVYLYPELMPTPALSFAVRHYGCVGGVMVTASHNPSMYNGYKVYNEEGCQVTLEAADQILHAIEEVGYFSTKTSADLDLEAFEGNLWALEGKHPLLTILPDQVSEAYIQAILERKTGIRGDNLEVVYTPLNGAGNRLVRRILDEVGVSKIHVVAEQELPDGTFPTCPYPNPEKAEALQKGLDLCQSLGTPDLLLATDPDCDRLGVAVRTVNKQTGSVTYSQLSGNEVGVLLLDFVCTNRPLPERPMALATIVSSKMAGEVAKAHGVQLVKVLTGFKFIGEQIGILEAKGEQDRFVFGFEESSGYLSGPHVRDKDAVNAAMLVCEAASYYKKQGLTLRDRLEELYQEYGYYRNELLEFNFDGASGMEKMNQFMNLLRENPPVGIAGEKVVEIGDYLISQRRVVGNSCAMASGYRPIRLPKSDVLEYTLSDGSGVIVRPSGTEPKLKIYLSAKGNSAYEAEAVIEDLTYTVKGWIAT